MKTLPLAAAIFCSTSLFLASVHAQEGLTVEVAGVQVINKIYPAKDPKEKNSFSGNMDTLVPFNSFEPGVSVALMISSPKGGLLDVNTEACKIETFADDKGTVLFDKDSSFNKGFGSFNKVSKDGKVALVNVEGKIPLAAGATKVTAKGTAALRVGSKTTKYPIAKSVLKKGSKVKAGSMEFTVTDAKAQGDEINIDFETKTDPATVASFKFIGADGKEIEGRKNMSGSMGFMGNKTYSFTYEVKTNQPQLAMEIEVWDDMKQINVPFNVVIPVSSGK